MKKYTVNPFILFWLSSLAGLLLLQNCRPKEDTVSPQQALIGDATLNRTLLVSRDEEIVRVDAATGRLFFHGQRFKGEGSIDNNVGLMSLDVANGQLIWLNNYFRYAYSLAPIVLADNGVFRSSQDTN
jgi:hypothetical protein